MPYTKRTWVDNVTPINAEHLNHMEEGIAALADESEQAELFALSGGHFKKLKPDAEHTVPTYKVDAEDAIYESGYVTGSDYMLCPKHLCIHFGDDTARCFLYFFDLVDGAYVPRWDIVSTTTSTKVKNYLNPANNVKLRMLDIPDGVYMRFSLGAGNVDLYGWDGESFGMPVSADASVRTSGGAEGALFDGGSSGLTLPGSVKYVLCKDSQIFAIWGCKDGVYTALDTSDSRRFWVPPAGYDFFRMRLYFGAQTPYEVKTRVGDVSDRVSVVLDSTHEEAASRAKKVLDACKAVCGLKWTAMQNLSESSKSNYTYKAGVEYNGIPYSSQWGKPHFIGWHISPHTFVNAAADPNSIFYKEVADNGTVTAPYYGLVCSSFASLTDGWPYPQTNAGFVYDPMVTLAWSAMPPLGAVFSDAFDHCVIPERIDRMGDVHAVSMYEAVRPVTSRTTRYSNINPTTDESKFNSTCLDEYLDNYGFVVRHMAATLMTDIPYADFDDVEIIAGSALPYKGDRCVYTSAEASVLINIKREDATGLVLTFPDGTTQTIAFEVGTAQVDVKSYLTQDGIYHIHTDVDSVQASFEFRTVTPITYTLTDGVVSFDRNDFWYAFCSLTGSAFFSEAEACTIPANANGDYSAWSQNGHRVGKVYAVLCKGEYGAYAVPCTT